MLFSETVAANVVALDAGSILVIVIVCKPAPISGPTRHGAVIRASRPARGPSISSTLPGPVAPLLCLTYLEKPVKAKWLLYLFGRTRLRGARTWRCHPRFCRLMCSFSPLRLGWLKRRPKVAPNCSLGYRLHGMPLAGSKRSKATVFCGWTL